MSPIANYDSILEIVFALNAMTYFFSIEPARRGELLGLYEDFRKHMPDFSRRDREAIKGYAILTHYSMMHFIITVSSLLFSIGSIGLMLYGASHPQAMVDNRLMIGSIVFMVTLVPLGSLWLTLICKSQFQKYLAGMKEPN